MPDASIVTTLMLDHVFTSAAGQQYSYTVLGEGAGAIPADESITLEVPVATMNTLLSYSSSWLNAPGSTGESGYQPLPAVALRLATVVGAKLDALTAGLRGETAGDEYAADALKVQVAGDDASSCKTLVNRFQAIAGFTYHDQKNVAVETNYLASIPVEAIQKFETSVLETDDISEVVGDLVAIPAPGSTGTANATAEPLKAAIQTLFEQAVDAGMVVAASPGDNIKAQPISNGLYLTLADVEAASVAGTDLPVYGVQWSAGQSLGFYVRFDLTKKRQFTLSSELGTANAERTTKVAFGGVEFDLDGEIEESTAVPVTYQIVLKAAAI
jgi:hypothetical protein